jgi:3-phosphoshikimate 1-carboxyvinyltransferase
MTGEAEDPRPIRPLASPPDATVRLPGSKSITNRALVAAALADGTSVLDGALLADDTEAMLGCLGRLGVAADVDPDGPTVVVHGLGGRVSAPSATLDARLSGTTSRFVMPLLALGSEPHRLDGAPPLRARPMGELIVGLRALGADVIEEGEPGHLPVVVTGPVTATAEGALRVRGEVSSQFLSGLLLAAPAMPEGLTVALEGALVSVPYVEMTLSVMRDFGVGVTRPSAVAYVVPAARYRARRLGVEPDASAASYVFAAAAITGGRVRVEGLSADSRQGDVRFVDVLEAMGAEVRREPSAIEVRGTGALRGIDVDLRDLSDTAQTLAVTAVFAEGPTEVRGIGFIRGKETNRIAAVVAELSRCGIRADETTDGFVVHPGRPAPAVVQTYDDHRMAMSFALLGLRAPGIAIADPACVAKTFPGYFTVLEGLGEPGGGETPPPHRRGGRVTDP